MDLSSIPPIAPRIRERVLRRGTIGVPKTPARPADAKWHGRAPTPVPETDRNWRPSEFRF